MSDQEKHFLDILIKYKARAIRTVHVNVVFIREEGQRHPLVYIFNADTLLPASITFPVWSKTTMCSHKLFIHMITMWR